VAWFPNFKHVLLHQFYGPYTSHLSQCRLIKSQKFDWLEQERAMIGQSNGCYLIGLRRWWVESNYLWISLHVFDTTNVSKFTNACSDLQMHSKLFTNECQAELCLHA